MSFDFPFCKIVRSSVILLLPLFSYIHDENTITNITFDWIAVGWTYKHLCGTSQEKDDMMFMIGRWCISHRKYDNLVEILTRVFDHILPTKAVPSNLFCLHVVIN